MVKFGSETTRASHDPQQAGELIKREHEVSRAAGERCVGHEGHLGGVRLLHHGDAVGSAHRREECTSPSTESASLGPVSTSR
jgi:hypothetical protein